MTISPLNEVGTLPYAQNSKDVGDVWKFGPVPIGGHGCQKLEMMLRHCQHPLLVCLEAYLKLFPQGGSRKICHIVIKNDTHTFV